MKILIIGQSSFGAAVYQKLKEDGHHIVGVFCPPVPEHDPLAVAALKDNISLFRPKSWKKDGKLNPQILDIFKKLNPELNVMAFVTQFIPNEILEFPKYKTIQYHPSLLPKHRGGSSINHAIINGDKETGFSIFWVDSGVDTGPILLQGKCPIGENDTATSVYTQYLFPDGVKGMSKALQMIEKGTFPRLIQNNAQATHEGLWKKENAKVDFNSSAQEVHNLIRGSDRDPGAWTIINDIQITLFGSRKVSKDELKSLIFEDVPKKYQKIGLKILVTKDAVLFECGDKNWIFVEYFEVNKKVIKSRNYILEIEDEGVKERQMNEKEKIIESKIYIVWKSLLLVDKIDHNFNFFEFGGNSMSSVQLVENINQDLKTSLPLNFISKHPTFRDFCYSAMDYINGGSESSELKFKSHEINLEKIKVSFPVQLLIDGKWTDSSKGKTFECINPATESLICSIQEADLEDVEKSVKAASRAFEYGSEWRSMTPRDRSYLVYKLAEEMEKHREELAYIESIDSGIPITLAKKTHIGMAIDSIRYFAGWAGKIHGKTIPIQSNEPNKSHLCFTKREPVGVCALILPWNFPAMLLCWKLGPCLASGNTVIIKPSKYTSLTALKICELACKVGFPKGVINLLTGNGTTIGKALSTHMKIHKVAFTGSTSIGKSIMSYSSESNLKRVSLELGGKSALIIFGDCDLKAACNGAASASWFNSGQNCIAGSRIYVENKIYDKFAEMMIEKAKARVLGDPLCAKTEQGPQCYKEHFESILKFIDLTVKEGGKLVYGGKPFKFNSKGYFITPAVFTELTDEMTITREETFGPICQLYRFKDGDIDEVIKRANSSIYGLAGGVFTSNMTTAMRVSDQLQAGTVFINEYNKTDVAAPFGGFGQSGFGRDLSKYSLEQFTELKTVTMKF